jgi:hypothetical protein
VTELHRVATEKLPLATNALGYVFVSPSGMPVQFPYVETSRLHGDLGPYSGIIWPSLEHLTEALSDALPGHGYRLGVGDALEKASRHGWIRVVEISSTFVMIVEAEEGMTLDMRHFPRKTILAEDLFARDVRAA